MTSSEKSPFVSFKSKKILRSSSSKPSIADGEPASVLSDRSPWSSKTPEKPINPPRRTSNRRAAYSVKQVREAAEKLRNSRLRPSIEPDSIICDGLEAARSSGATEIQRAKKTDESSDLPERYQMLIKFFDSFDNSIRLLIMKGSMCTFTNISSKIEAFTNRRFTYSHLAQLKFILPEAIEIKKIVTRDELTFCMKPNLHITLNINAITERKQQLSSQSGHPYMRKLFRSRLLDYFKSHPEDDIPEEELPEPFNKSKQVLLTSETDNSSLAGESSNFLPASHLSKSFSRGFSMKALQTEKKSTSPFQSIPVSNLSDSKFTSSTFDDESHQSSSLPVTPLKEMVVSKTAVTPLKEMVVSKTDGECTSGELVLTPLKLMSVTPIVKTQKRCFMTPNNDADTSKLLKRPPRSRSLKFDSPTKCKKNVKSNDDDILDILPDHVLQSIRDKEMKAIEERDPAISQAKWRRQMISSLPKLFDTIVFLYQSIKRSVLTKNDLIHKIISSHLDIVDRREIEEQVRLLQELAPEWIYEKFASTGDLLVYVNKISNPQSIRARMAEAK
ncbi:CDT1-like protein a, chloroplastic isoform X2 [Impatiens glandulifera]|uniref:CDT1-like protein a, chloroplastic isoform X2 n=1 Tax=Impatiens glandulifera TaxID=253017 RepID=UPI001FB0698A|nr:CDT1-like protein a, chloroplastic isoform X2 [Impatiens glandulifera]